MLRDVIVGGIEAVGSIVDEVITSDEERMQMKLKVAELAQQPANNQAAITLSESKHASIFVAGWRPWVGWCAGIGLFVSVVVWPLAATGARLWGVDLGEQPVDTALLLTILGALLGTSGLRTWEKFKGINRDNMK